MESPTVGVTIPGCAGPVGADLCAGAATSSGYNFANETVNSCGLTATGESSLDANNPLLGALANNAGPTSTQLPQAGSPLVDAIPDPACQTAPLATGITADQRGLPRPTPVGGACDIGAVEVKPAAPSPTAPGDHDHKRETTPVAQPMVIAPTFTGQV